MGSDAEERATPAIITPQQPRKGLLRAFTSLRQRNFRLFWCGQMISLTGSWMQSIGQTWLVLELTHSAFQLGLVGALQSLPVLLFALVGGVLAWGASSSPPAVWPRSSCSMRSASSR